MTEAYFRRARSDTRARFSRLREQLGQAAALIRGSACVYATGSFGRQEAGPESDLDLFIVIKTSDEMKRGESVTVNRLSAVDETRLKYHIIEAVAACGIAEFDGGGKYLESHQFGDFTRWLGSREDDYRNTLTGRLLLLLESRPLLGEAAYEELLDAVISAYFKDYEGNESKFVPAFLINDILRMWRTFCVNYEFDRKKGNSDWKIKNLKLKYSRMLTCYSAIIYLLAVHMEAGRVSPADVAKLVSLTPTERLEAVARSEEFASLSNRADIDRLIEDLLGEYSAFLELTHKKKGELIAEFEKDEKGWKARSYEFGSKLTHLMRVLSEGADEVTGLYRFVLI